MLNAIMTPFHTHILEINTYTKHKIWGKGLENIMQQCTNKIPDSPPTVDIGKNKHKNACPQKGG